MSLLEIEYPNWSEPILANEWRYVGVKGGRASGKSHFFAEWTVMRLINRPNTKAVCIREIQKSLKHSAKALIEAKIESFGASYLFDITQTEIKHKRGTGLILFQGMQDHTADSIKSLEGFDIAWVEEAQSLSLKSLRLLRPTIRAEDSQIWFSWNPDKETDPVDEFMVKNAPSNAITVHVNYDQNKHLTKTIADEIEQDLRRMQPEDFAHIWLGEYLERSDAIIFSGKWRIDDFTPGKDWNGPYYGIDFGFANDPTTGVKTWVHNNKLYIEHDAGKVGLELDDTAQYLTARIPDIETHISRADSARPESISYLKRHGLPRMTGVKKGAGSVEDGIEHMKSYDEIIVHPRCEGTQKEMRLYSYKIDKKSGDVLPVVVDANNHYIDAIRYAIQPLMKSQKALIYIA